MADENNAVEPTETQTDTSTQTSTDQSAASDQSNEKSTTTTTDGGDDNLDLAKSGDKTGDDADKGGDDKSGDDKGDKGGDENALFGAPADDAAYEISGLPEGMSVDTEALEAFTPLARELNLSNEGMSKLAGVYAEKILPHVVQTVEQRVNEATQTAIKDQRTAWEGEARALVAGNGKVDGNQLKTGTGDEISFDGNDIKKVMTVSAKAIDRVMPAGFREFLDETGLGQHPAMIAGMYAVGKLVSEDTTMERSSGEKKKSDADLFYGS